MHGRRLMLTAAVALALSGMATSAQAQGWGGYTGAYTERQVSAYGCSAFGTKKWCTPSFWTFRLYDVNPGDLLYAYVLPGVCKESNGGPLTPPPGYAGTNQNCWGGLSIPGAPGWAHVHWSFQVRTTRGTWSFCDFQSNCAPTPPLLGQIQQIRGAYLVSKGDDIQHWDYTYSVTPEPVTMALLGTGLFGVGGAAWRRRRKEGARPAA
jgi:hypothetical protein